MRKSEFSAWLDEIRENQRAGKALGRQEQIALLASLLAQKSTRKERGYGLP